MSIHDVVLPECFSVGSTGGPGYATEITTLDSGAEVANARWSQARHRYDLIKAVQKRDEIALLLDFFHQRGGAANGFLVQDPQDHSTTPTHVGPIGDGLDPDDFILTEPGAGDGSRTTFQLVKRYTTDSRYPDRLRTITRVDPATLTVTVDGSPTTAFTLDQAVGQITFASPPPTNQPVAWAGMFWVPVRFTADFDKWMRVQGGQAIDSIRSMPMVEILDHIGAPEDVSWGGATVLAQQESDVDIYASYGKFLIVETALAPRALNLPSAVVFPPGGEHYRIVNIGTWDLIVQGAYNSPVTLVQDESTGCWVGPHPTTGVPVWYLV